MEIYSAVAAGGFLLGLCVGLGIGVVVSRSIIVTTVTAARRPSGGQGGHGGAAVAGGIHVPGEAPKGRQGGRGGVAITRVTSHAHEVRP